MAENKYIQRELFGKEAFSAQRPSGKRRRYALDESAFDQISEATAYWAGFLLADGCVRCQSRPSGAAQWTLSLGLAMRDFDHVVAFRDFLKSTQPVKTFANPTGYANGQGVARLCVSSRRLVAALERFGVTWQKSRHADAGELAGGEHMRHFIRGVVDGDGSVGWCASRGRSLPCVSIVAVRPCIDQIHAHLTAIYSEVRARPRALKATSKILVFAVTGRPAVALLRSLYEDCGVALARKASVARQILSQWAPCRGPHRRRCLDDFERALAEHGGTAAAAQSLGLTPASFVTLRAKFRRQKREGGADEAD